MLIAVISYCVPVTVWIFCRYKYKAKYLPLAVGIISYTVLISPPRALARYVILDGLENNRVLYYFIMALLSGVFEEIGRYIVFRYIIPNHDSLTDCFAYGIGHGAVEIFLTHNIMQNTVWDSLIDADCFIFGILFSSAMSVLVFCSVHYSDDKKLLYTAIIIHTLSDYIAAYLFLDVVDTGVYIVIDKVLLVLICLYSYKVYRKKSEGFY